MLMNDLQRATMLCLLGLCLRQLSSPPHSLECLSLFQQTASISITVHTLVDQFFVLGHKNLEISVGVLQILTHI